MIEWVKAGENRCMYVATQHRRSEILRSLSDKDRGFLETRIFTPQDVSVLRGGHWQVGIDDLDLVLMEIFDNPISIVSISPRNEMYLR